MTRISLRQYLVGALLVTATTFILWLLRDVLTSANFSLIYLLVVLWVAIYQGTRPSFLASILSFLCFNYFLVKPLYTFAVNDPSTLLELFIFLTCATMTGQLASYARRQTRDAQERTYEQNILYELTSAFNQLTDTESVYSALKTVLQRVTGLGRIDILPNNEDAPIGKSVLYLPLRGGDKVYGVLQVTFEQPPPESLVQLISASTVQASLALQRIELTERAQQSKSFEEADRLKTALLHAVSHDLRTPITIIKTSASNLLHLNTTLSEVEHIELFKTIEHEADHLDKMVGNLLDISRLQAGAMQIKAEPNMLEEVAGDVAARVFELSHQERIRICIEEMPLVPFDYGLMLQALQNLVENSLRYEPASSKIEICGSADELEARISIVNHGPNVPPEERQFIMEPFYRGHKGNIGLGLAISKGIIEAHHGRLWVEDTPGGGATFIFALPLNTASAA